MNKDSILSIFNQTLEHESLNPCELCGTDIHDYHPCDYGYRCSLVESQSFYTGEDGYVFTGVYC